MIEIRYGDNLPILQSLSSSAFDLIYVDPPFNTGATRAHTTIKSIRDEPGRVGVLRQDVTGLLGRCPRNRQRSARESCWSIEPCPGEDRGHQVD